MRVLMGFVKATMVGGLLFLLPLALIIVAVGKLVSILRPVSAEATTLFAPYGLGAGGEVAVVVATLVFASFLAGLIGRTAAGRRLADGLETFLLNRVPGYQIVKSAAADAAHSLARIETSGETSAVFVRTGDGWQIGFLTDRIGEDMWAVFVPDAPSPTSGVVMFVNSEQFVDSGLRAGDALRVLRQLGSGSAKMFDFRQG